MIKHNLKIIALFLFIFSIVSPGCRKEGPGGKAKVSGTVLNNGVGVSTAVLYIKYGASIDPGTDISVYDKSYKCDNKGGYSITPLVQGNYWLYAVAQSVTTQGITQQLSGGVAINISSRKQSLVQNIAIK